MSSFVGAAKAKGGISEEDMETRSTSHWTGFLGGFAACARGPLVFSLSPCAKQDMIPNGKHNA